MKLKIPFYYHIILFLGLFLIFNLWTIGVNNQKLESLFNKTYFLFNIGYILAIFIVYLLNFYFFCSWFLNKKKLLLYIISIPISLIIFSGLRYFFQEVIVYEITGIHNYVETSRNTAYYIRDNFFFGLPSIFLSSLSFLFWQFQETQKQNQKLLFENKKAEFQMLKSQVSPHFLFNTLNSFYSQLIGKDDNIASDILTLSDLLRYVITETDKEEVLLTKEIQFINNYIHLQQKRFEDQLNLDFAIKGDYTSETILPSVLIHFIENVFKHGKLNDINKKAIILILIKKESLEITTFNYFIESENYSSTGIGFKNLIKRLEYTYSDKFTLNKTSENNTFKTYLRIPLKNSL
ncbi:histidine kinase [Flavobacterium branchiarum]|uniref:Sensor histidine kinase n=1 Tax=Flavobacterium branchiarum TaxID=1114870 RepID=A0ABV5FKL3_9FLAO|nr:sensor histidine kinase [Flavobacterium branchiarum]MDN3672241.1 histidine kinase [Flavobacterium branchiarum]